MINNTQLKMLLFEAFKNDSQTMAILHRNDTESNLYNTLEWKYMRLMHEKYKGNVKCPRIPPKHESTHIEHIIKVNKFFNSMCLNENDDIVCKTEFGFNSIISKHSI